MKITYSEKTNKFIISCEYSESRIVSAMPERRFRKASGTWSAPALRRNLRYMETYMSHPDIFDPQALAVFRKKLAELSVNTEAEGFPDDFKFKNTPMSHQMDALNKFYPLDAAAILFEQGLGKTYTTINLLAAWHQAGKIDAAVVVCPSSIKLVWELEIDKHSPINTTRHVLQSGKYKQADTFILEKNGFQWLIVGIEALSQGKAHEYMKHFFVGRNVAMVIDESSRIKNRTTIRTERCFEAGEMAKKRIILSGTSISEGVENWYSQFKFLDPNILGYSSFYPFRDHFCVTLSMEVAHNRFQTKIVGYKNQEELLGLVSPVAMRVEKKDALDLPDKVFMNRYVTMTKEQSRAYNMMKDEFISLARGAEYEVTTVLEQMMRLQQITGGFHPHDNSETIEPVAIGKKNAKVEETLELLDEIDGKVIVWCQFNPEIAALRTALSAADVPFVEFSGSCDDVEKAFAVDRFQNHDDVKVLIASRAAAYGLTLTAASYAIYFSQGYSYEQYAQSQDRIHRIGQTNHCVYINLLCQGTIDEKIMDALATKQGTAEGVYAGLKDYDNDEMLVKTVEDDLITIIESL